MNWEVGIILIWSGFLLVGTVTAAAVFLWGVRNGQFGDQEHARSLPLLSAIPDDGADGEPDGRVRHD